MDKNNLERTKVVELRKDLQQLVNDNKLNIVSDLKVFSLSVNGNLLVTTNFTTIQFSKAGDSVHFMKNDVPLFIISTETFKHNFKFAFYLDGANFKFYKIEIEI